MTGNYDIAIVGAGMAGASLAAEMVGKARILLLEAEDRPGYHATGRSAAFWTESYGGPEVQPLTAASGPFLIENGFLAPRAALTIGRAGQESQVDAFVQRNAKLGVDIKRIEHDGMSSLVPGLREAWTCGALEPSCCDIDVAALHQHYLAIARKGGVDLQARRPLRAAQALAGGWDLQFDDNSRVRAGLLVNAAGAWADDVAKCAGVQPLGIVPYRRTVARLNVSPAVPDRLPLVLDVSGKFYFKPESGRLWLSPHDETPSPACDVAPEEIDVATAIDRLESVVDWSVERVEHRWAGLRSFAADRLPVYGFDPILPQFFWFAGQGGFGIQSAPAAARLAAGLILDIQQESFDPGRFAPARFH